MNIVPDPKIYGAEDEARHRAQDLDREAQRISRWPRTRKAPWWMPLFILGVMVAGVVLAVILL